MARIVNYRIIIHTMDEYGAGTDNNVYLRMHNDATGKESDLIDLDVSLERNETEALTIPHEDMGVINRITLDVEGTLDDTWSPHYIRILRDASNDDPSRADGWSEFIIKRALSYDLEDFEATTVISAQVPVTVKAVGDPGEHSDILKIVQFDHNPGQSSQTVMKYVETWSDIDRVLISAEDHDKLGGEAKITYESPEFKLGKFGVELGIAWENEITRIKQEETEKISQREFDWSFEADPQSYVFRLQIFRAKYLDQIYQDTEGNSRAIRKLNSEIVPVHMGDFLFIPRMDDGKADPILMKELEDDWFDYMDAGNVEWIKKRHLDKWLAKGWVVYENQVPITEEEQTAVVITDALHIREGHDPKSKVVGYLKEGDAITVLETWTQGGNIWAKLKPSQHAAAEEQWSAMLIGKNRYIQFTKNIRE